MPMGKLDADTIKKINSYSEDKSNTEIWKELWLHRSTVWKYRKDIADTLKDKLSKWDKKKLQLLEHYTDKDIQEMLNYIAQNTKKEVNEVLSEPWHLKFALLSDTHFGAKQCAKDELWEFYDRAKEKWVEAFVHCGDIVDGSDVYKGQQFEQSEVWFSNQLQDITQNYPNVWIPTYFIWWNHDEAYLKGNWVNICKAIETVRQDLINLWFYDARLRLNWIDINLHHWGGSLSYAKDYKMKKYLDSLPVEWQPDIFALWHYHTALYDLHRGIHGFMPWAFLKENLLAKRFNLDNTIWGWVIEIDKNEKGQSKLNMEFIKL
jgi:predicted phosphodiesterase